MQGPDHVTDRPARIVYRDCRRALQTGRPEPGAHRAAMQYIIVDLEATCWEKGGRQDRMETIEIGAARLRSAPVGL